MMAASAVSSVSVLPADLCGYSGQKLIGAWSDIAAAGGEVRRPHRPHLDEHQQLSGGGACAGARRHRGIRRSPHRCSWTTSPSEYPEAMLTELVELPGGSFRMGSTQLLSGRGAGPHRDGRRVGGRTPSGDQRSVRRIRRRHRLLTVAEQAARPGAVSRGVTADLVPGALVFRPTGGPVDLRDWRQWWDWEPGACWRHPFGAGQRDRRTRLGPSGRAGRLSRRGGLRAVGRSPAADRGRMGVRGAGGQPPPPTRGATTSHRMDG